MPSPIPWGLESAQLKDGVSQAALAKRSVTMAMSLQKETKACARLENNSSLMHFNVWPADGKHKPGTGAQTTLGR